MTLLRELLALVSAVKYFHPYLYGLRFQARTDLHALQWLTKFKEPEGRWLKSLAKYDIEVIHRPARKHIIADTLSGSTC